MHRTRLSGCVLGICTGIFLCSFVASAAELGANASIDLQYTDNAASTSANKVDDLIVNYRVGADIDADSGPFQLNASTSLNKVHYTKGTFGDQEYFNLTAIASWEMLRDRVSWTLQDFFTQTSINSLEPNTPENIQDTNVLTFGSALSFPISSRQSVSLQPEYRKFTYSSQNIDNQQNSLNASWNYQIFRAMSVGLSAGVNKVDYDDPAIIDNTSRTASLTLSGQRSRSNYGANLGVTSVDSEAGNSTRGLTGNANWTLNLTGYSLLDVSIASNLTDTNNGILDAALNPEGDGFSNQQISTEVFRNSTIVIAYSRGNERLNVRVSSNLSKQNYELAPLDRKVKSFRVALRYSLTSVVSTGVTISYDRNELTDIDREDDQYNIDVNLNYGLSRSLSSVFNLKYLERKSTLDTQNFSELSVFASLVYSY